MIRRLAAVSLLFVLALFAGAELSRSARASCDQPGIIKCCPNIIWVLKDSVSACPAGDSVFAGRPSKLRIGLYYSDANCDAHVGVPPESIWAQVISHTGNLTVNDEGAKIFADDSTDSGGFARITIPSFSGCGTVSIRVFVSNSIVKTKVFTVRTTDSNADGRTTAADTTARCDLNYNGSADAAERDTILKHVQDWHRNALFGTLVKRTVLCDTIPCTGDSSNTMGSGDLSWSPSGRRIVFSLHYPASNCKIFHVASAPSGGNARQEFTWPGNPDPDDYDPSWSPLGDPIFWVRDDKVIYRKGIPGIATDTTEVAVYSDPASACCQAISPDGRTIAFSRLENQGQAWAIWTILATGDSLRRVTAAINTNRDWYPKWSPDGQTLIFDRLTTGFPLHRAAYTVPAFFQGPPPAPTLFYGDVVNAILPAYAEDGAVVVSGVASDYNVTTAHTLDATGTAGFRAIENYPGYTFDNPFARLSPDGTRLAQQAKSPFIPGGATTPDLWAVRRNMNLPPQFTAVGGQSVADSTARVFFTMLQGQAYQITLTASDPEADHLTYHAYYLQQGMAFDTTTRTFSWTPPSGTAGKTFNVKFGVTTASGGADAIIALITVNSSLHPGGTGAQLAQGTVSAVSEGAGLVRFAFHGVTPKAAEVALFDVAGRRLTRLQGHAGETLRWDGRDTSGRKVASGVYFYRVRAEGATYWGRLVYLR